MLAKLQDPKFGEKFKISNSYFRDSIIEKVQFDHEKSKNHCFRVVLKYQF